VKGRGRDVQSSEWRVAGSDETEFGEWERWAPARLPIRRERQTSRTMPQNDVLLSACLEPELGHSDYGVLAAKKRRKRKKYRETMLQRRIDLLDSLRRSSPDSCASALYPDS